VLPLLTALGSALPAGELVRRSLALLAAGLLLALASTAGASVDVELFVDVSSDLEATLLSMGEDVQPAAVVGSFVVRLELIEHPTHGLVAQNVEILSGSLTVGDLGWSLSGPFETLTASLADGAASASSSGPIVATPIAANTSDVPTSDVALTLEAGDLSASGTVAGHGITVGRSFAADPRAVDLSAPAQILTVEAPSGVVGVRFDLPITLAVPIDPPFLVSWIQLDGTLVLSGTIPSTLPASPHGLWAGAALVVAWWAAVRRRRLH
jgi:hypothetical protein